MIKAFAQDKVRLDKWLWAARFFKTRRLAKEAIDGGKVHCAGRRIKAAKEISVGDRLTVHQGISEKEVLVMALSDRRRGATEAALLYEETVGSKALRDKLDADRKAGSAGFIPSDHKPSKKERRQIHKLLSQKFQVPDE
ncbi:MAG: RNA-binding protein [Gammaproteobacteria bacterium]|nr:RNA-binding protein [Gammaproteobacteria bacterium]MCP4090987.1 RNA-binding protein [Gammaproteobacteria bacterium]MCP4277487.1 RNA-binding protein [Gammaproteobacteria bacterium]MCP4831452.1 RNA-binding protein [Gammaproteobacteria bacterium]MCP4928520.1 RNA-binding protein [Gammaproteobacteria bacterium]